MGAAERRPRILIVDDSAVMRSLLRTVVSTDSRLEVAGTAVDGATALACLPHTRPDLILLDFEMPVMDGLATLRELKKRDSKVPVIMCSSLTRRGARVTVEALAGGASDYVTKPTGTADRESAIKALTAELIPKIHVLLGRDSYSWRNELVSRSMAGVAQFQQTCVSKVAQSFESISCLPEQFPATPSIVAIGVSTGGPAALEAVLPHLPEEFPVPVVLVQHMPELFTGLFAERLNAHCRLRVAEAREGEPVREGSIYIARGDWHLETVEAKAPKRTVSLHLSRAPFENHCRPSVDVLFRSVASVYRAGVLGVILTGMGCDGLAGCRAIREQGGCVLVQDQPSSTVWGMPGAVATAGLANKVLPLQAVAQEIIRLAGQTASSACPMVL